MADPLGNFVPEFIENEVEREAIVKLAKMITDRVPQKLGMKKITKYDPEYWGLSAMCTDEMAEIALKMGVRKPKTLDQMVKLTGIEKKHLEEVLQQMAVNGVIEYNWENPQHEKQYVLPIFVPGSAEFSCMNAKMLEKHPELGLFFERMSRIALEGLAPFMPEGGVGMHVIPQDMTSFVTWFIYAVGMGIISVFVIVGINYMMEPKEFKELILRVKGIVRR